MVRGFYSAAAGIFSQQKAIDAISNNIANTATTGYKSQSTAESSFGEHLVARLSSNPKLRAGNIGPGAFITVNSKTYADYTQGMLEHTGRNVDVAIQGEGFFLVRSEKFGDVLTRNGEFELDDRGDLVLPGVGKVLADNRRVINLKGSGFTVGSDGAIYEDGRETDRFFIAKIGKDSEPVKIGQGTYFIDEAYEKADKESFAMVQGYIEKANVNMAKELSRLIAGQSHFQSCAQVLKIYDRINEISVNRIGSLE